MDNNRAGGGLGDDAGARRPTPVQAGIVYSLIVLLFLVVGGRAQQREFYSGILITEFVLILVPVFAFLIVFRFDIRSVLRLNKIRFINLLLVFFITLFAIPVAGVLNLINLWLVHHLFGKVIVVQPPVATDLKGLLLSILIIGGSAGICEEVLFRGFIQKSLETLGTVKSILITALLFGLIHIDFQKLFGTFFLGVLIGFIVYRTHSLFGGMFAHFTNNSAAIVITYLSAKFTDLARSSGMSGLERPVEMDQFFSIFEKMSAFELAVFIAGWAFIVLFCVAVLTGLMIAFVRTTSERAEKIQAQGTHFSISSVLAFVPGLLLIGMKYIDEGLLLLGRDQNILTLLSRLAGRV